MQLLDNGIGVQSPEWIVNEPQAAGFSRVYYIISGEIVYRDDSITKELLPGIMYVFPAQRPYKITHDPKKPIECLWFHMDLFPYDIDRILEFDVSANNNKTLYYLINALMNEGKFFQNNDSLYISLSESLAEYIVKHPFVKGIDNSLAEILSYLRKNLFSPMLNVNTASRHFGYSTAHFIRVFKAGMNDTPHRYITMLRMSAAAKHLTEGNSVFETANLCGYTDVKTFARVFKKIFGVPPSEYVKYYRHKA